MKKFVILFVLLVLVVFPLFSQFNRSYSVQLWIDIDNEFIQSTVTSELTDKISENLNMSVYTNKSMSSEFTVMIVSSSKGFRSWTITCMFDDVSSTTTLLSNDIESCVDEIYTFIENQVYKHWLDTRYIAITNKRGHLN